MLFEKIEISSKNTFFNSKPLVYKNETQQVHNEIQINVVHVNMHTSTRLYSHVAYLRLLYCSIPLACIE